MTELERIDFRDGQEVWRPPGSSCDPLAWAKAILPASRRASPLLRVRDLAVRPFGLRPTARPEGATLFPVLASDATTVVLGLDDRHLDFRVTVEVAADRVVLVTTVQLKSLLGRAYFFLVRRVHPYVVRRRLRAAHPSGG